MIVLLDDRLVQDEFDGQSFMVAFCDSGSRAYYLFFIGLSAYFGAREVPAGSSR